MMQGSTYSSSASTSTSSAESTTKYMKTSEKVEINRHYLVSPTSKQTNILWSVEEDQHLVGQEEEEEEGYNIHDSAISSMEEDIYHPGSVTVRKKNSRKRRSNGSLIAPSSLAPSALLSSTPMTRNNSPLPPLPTVENFLTIMDAPASPDSSYFSARSTSSSSSSQSTLNSISLDDVTDNLAKAQISSSHAGSQSDEKPDAYAMQVDSPPTPPPKDRLSAAVDRMDIEKNLTDTHSIANKQQKRTNSLVLKRNSATEMRITTTGVQKHSKYPPPKSADANLSQMRPPIPPRTSSMPLPPTPPKSAGAVPPLPAGAKKKASAYSRRSSTKTLDESTTWSALLGSTSNKKDELMKRAKLGRSLGTATGPSKKIKKSDSSKLLKVTENGNIVLFFEMIEGRLQAIAGTKCKLFERLADETAQDEEYVDIYLMSHAHFISSLELLNLLINRFHLEPSPGEDEYFRKWQFLIQTKVLNVIERWILFYYQDFKYNEALEKRLNAFLYYDPLLLGIQFKQQLEKIRSSLKYQITQFSEGQHQIIRLLANSTQIQGNNNHSNFNFHFPFVNSNHTPPLPPVHFTNSPRRPSNGLFNLTSLSTPPDSPCVSYANTTGLYTSFASLESKDIARYLTLADYYLFKSIQAHGLLNNQKIKRELDVDYVELMTKRANMLSHWVVHEICSISFFKPKRALLKKFIEIAKLCLELNNFHTCMVITMGLSSAPKLKDIWESLSNRDMNTFASLQKLLDVSLNMRHYRQKIQLVKSPSVPFLPVVLKDQTFYNENSTFSIHHPELINFSKFRSIRQFVEKMKLMTHEPYWFANDLTRYPFFPTPNNPSPVTHNGQLDSIGDWLESRLAKVEDCYLHCDLLLNM
ncbi:ras guanine nucleotide exchange factor domain-containing protein [Helicostylum pulchrum]|nr:ras guanine nucleotide exchange factor domain-containing protein [Helicostylum pulchrum]